MVEAAGKVVLSCVQAVGMQQGGLPQQTGTALSITGAGVWLGGITIYGCSETAVNITGKDAYLHVRISDTCPLCAARAEVLTEQRHASVA